MVQYCTPYNITGSALRVLSGALTQTIRIPQLSLDIEEVIYNYNTILYYPEMNRKRIIWPLSRLDISDAPVLAQEELSSDTRLACNDWGLQ